MNVKPPTKQGWYWVRVRPSGKVRLAWCGPNAISLGLILVPEAGDHWFAAEDIHEWLGPARVTPKKGVRGDK